MTMDQDFFEDAELSDDNFLVPSLKQLVSNLSCIRDPDLHLQLSLRNFKKILGDRFPSEFGYEQDNRNSSLGADLMALDQEDGSDEEDGPVVVSEGEVQASMDRVLASQNTMVTPEKYSTEIQKQYPLLFAARSCTEDIVMTCARVLDAASDVSLVREAAAYLEEVEAKRSG
jgi:A1 cistron-splicing factor AAR2